MKNSWSSRVWPGPSTTDPAHVIKCNQKNNAEMICIEIYNLSLRVAAAAAAVQETALPRVDEKETERLKEREREGLIIRKERKEKRNL